MRFFSFFVVSVGCGGPTFTNLGNGVGVPVETIERYAAEHGVSRAEARTQLRIQSEKRRSKEQARTIAIRQCVINPSYFESGSP